MNRKKTSRRKTAGAPVPDEKLNLSPAQCVLADEKIARAKSRRTFQKQNRTQAREGRSEPGLMQLARLRRRPFWHWKLIDARQFFCGGRQIGVLHPSGIIQSRREQDRRFGERRSVGRGVKRVEKICERAVEGIATRRKLCDFREAFRSYILPSSNNPSTRYCVFTGIRLAG